MSAMALSVPPPQNTWDRTLPNPAALLSNGIHPRRSSSLLQHHISSDQFLAPAADESGRRSTLLCLPRPENDETREELRQRQASVMSGEETTESSSEGTSPPESSGFCLCVPEPKIPRPRNGKPSDAQRAAFVVTDSWSKLSYCTGNISTPRLWHNTLACRIRTSPRSSVHNGSSSLRRTRTNGKRLRKYVSITHKDLCKLR